MTKKNRRKNTAPPAATAILPTNTAPASVTPTLAPAEDLDIQWERYQLTSLCTPVPDTLDDRFGALSDEPADCLAAYRQALAYGQDMGEAIVGQRWLLALGIGLRAGRAMAGTPATSIDMEAIERDAYEKGELEGKRMGFVEGRDFEKKKVRKMSGMFSACVTVDVGVGTDLPSTPIPSPAPEPLPSAPSLTAVPCTPTASSPDVPPVPPLLPVDWAADVALTEEVDVPSPRPCSPPRDLSILRSDATSKPFCSLQHRARRTRRTPHRPMFSSSSRPRHSFRTAAPSSDFAHPSRLDWDRDPTLQGLGRVLRMLGWVQEGAQATRTSL
ncbi:PH domain-containing protein [Favolaschia claudopus]|uniref:PH domain-containing protein n=1 Tax=Favolaschia claudopus TaxID=2862362 RepID=A0AAV9ZWS0_9AGAR